jgi:hypothetical protein
LESNNERIGYKRSSVSINSVKEVEMKRWILVVILCIFISGCVSSQIIPTENTLSSIRNISIVPIEGRPLVLHPDTKDDKMALDALMRSTNSLEVSLSKAAPAGVSSSIFPLSTLFPLFFKGDLAVIGVALDVVAVTGATALLAYAAVVGREIPGETAVIETSQLSETVMPSNEYTKMALTVLQQEGSRDVRMIDGYIKLPIRDRSITWHMENWLGPIRRSYNADVSTVDYSVVGSDLTDAVLEVGVLDYAYFNEKLVLEVFVRLVDPRTKQVLGRVRKRSSSKVGPLTPLLLDNGKGMKWFVLEMGNRSLAQCLTEIRLITE